MFKKLIFITTITSSLIAHQTIEQQLNEGRAALSARDKEKAFNILQSILSAEPNNINALLFLGVAHYYDNNSTKAIPYVAKASKLSGQNPGINKTLALILNDHGDFNTAIKLFELLHENDHTDEQIK